MARRKGRVDRPLPAHPYRDTALVYGIMAAVLVLVAALTGGDVIRALLVAVAFFLVATAWTCWKFRVRIRERDAASAASSKKPRAAEVGQTTTNEGVESDERG